MKLCGASIGKAKNGKDRGTCTHPLGSCGTHGNGTCPDCGDSLILDNASPSIVKVGSGRCSKCAVKYQQQNEKKDKRAYWTQVRKAKVASLKFEVFSHYCGGIPRCQCPGCDVVDMCFLQLDHIVSKGRDEAMRFKRLYQRLKDTRYPSGFQVLCANCNWAKRTNSQCPLAGLPHCLHDSSPPRLWIIKGD